MLPPTLRLAKFVEQLPGGHDRWDGYLRGMAWALLLLMVALVVSALVD